MEIDHFILIDDTSADDEYNCLDFMSWNASKYLHPRRNVRLCYE